MHSRHVILSAIGFLHRHSDAIALVAVLVAVVTTAISIHLYLSTRACMTGTSAGRQDAGSR